MLDRLKSLFIIEDEESKPKSQAADKASGDKKAPGSSVSSARPKGSGSAGKGKITSKFTNILFGAMEKNNQQGFDYLEFKQSLQNLAKMPMDEPTRFKSAFAMASTMGVTPAKLVQSAKFYTKVLEGEKNKFQQAVENQEEKQIGDRQDTLKQLEATIKEKNQMIEQLKKEIQEAQQRQEQIEKKLAAAHDKVVSTKNDFFASYQSLVGQIQKDIENMERYLK